MTVERLMLALVVAAAAVPRCAVKSPGTFAVRWRHCSHVPRLLALWWAWMRMVATTALWGCEMEANGFHVILNSALFAKIVGTGMLGDPFSAGIDGPGMCGILVKNSMFSTIENVAVSWRVAGCRH
jgi:hypothetical protein